MGSQGGRNVRALDLCIARVPDIVWLWADITKIPDSLIGTLMSCSTSVYRTF